MRQTHETTGGNMINRDFYILGLTLQLPILIVVQTFQVSPRSIGRELTQKQLHAVVLLRGVVSNATCTAVCVG